VSASGIISCEVQVFVAEALSLSRSPDAPYPWEKFRLNVVGTQTPWIARNQMVGDFALF